MGQPAYGGACRNLIFTLLVAFVAFHIVGFIVGPDNSSGSARIPLFYRIAASLSLVLCGWILRAFAPGELATFGTLIALGMTFGALGDMAMGKVIPSPDPLIAGMVFFGLCHVFYISGYLHIGAQLSLNDLRVRLASLLVLALIALAAWVFLVNSPDIDPARNYGALVYALVISVMTGFALALAIQAREFVPTVVGAILFLASDLLLASCMFRGLHWHLVNDFIWGIYILGEALIVFSPVYAVKASARLAPAPQA